MPFLIFEDFKTQKKNIKNKKKPVRRNKLLLLAR